MKKELERKYRMTDPELCMYVSNLIGFITRDQVEFTIRGVDVIARDALEALGDAYEVFPNDAFYQGYVTIAVNDKNAARESSTIQIRAIISYVRIKWGSNSPQVSRFKASKMTNLSDRGFLSLARQAVTLATEYSADLLAVGLTQAMIDTLEATAQTMENEMNNISEKEALRDTKTQERIADGNELYGFVAQYCEIGKLIWQDTDEAKYNDYLIYPGQSTSLPKPQNLTAVVDAGNPNNILIDFDAVPLALEYKLYFAEAVIGYPSGDFDQNGVSATNHFDTPLIAGKRNYWKVRAFNAESESSYSDEVYIDG